MFISFVSLLLETVSLIYQPLFVKNRIILAEFLVSRSQTLFFLLCGGGKEKGLVNIDSIVVGLSRDCGDSTVQLPDC